MGNKIEFSKPRSLKHLIIILSLFIFGCATAPKIYVADKLKGQWEAKLKISDLKENKTYNLDMDVIAQKPNQLRAEVSGTLGVALASVLVKDKEISYAVHRSKRFFVGKTGDKVLFPVLQVDFNPALLINIFFDEPIREAGWNCLTTPEHTLISCAREADKLLIQWQDRVGENKRIIVKAESFEIQLVVSNFNAEPKALDKAFALAQPVNYRLHKVD